MNKKRKNVKDKSNWQKWLNKNSKISMNELSWIHRIKFKIMNYIHNRHNFINFTRIDESIIEGDITKKPNMMIFANEGPGNNNTIGVNVDSVNTADNSVGVSVSIKKLPNINNLVTHIAEWIRYNKNDPTINGFDCNRAVIMAPDYDDEEESDDDDCKRDDNNNSDWDNFVLTNMNIGEWVKNQDGGIAIKEDYFNSPRSPDMSETLISPKETINNTTEGTIFDKFNGVLSQDEKTQNEM